MACGSAREKKNPFCHIAGETTSIRKEKEKEKGKEKEKEEGGIPQTERMISPPSSSWMGHQQRSRLRSHGQSVVNVNYGDIFFTIVFLLFFDEFVYVWRVLFVECTVDKQGGE